MTVDDPAIAERTLDAAESPAMGQHRGSRRETILDGASELFSEYGYFGASLRDIAGKVGISHPGMLHHFASKQDLLGGVIERLEDHAQRALESKDGFCTDGETLQQSLVETWDPASPEIQLMATLDAEAVSEGHPGRFRMARLRRVHEHILTHCFERLAANGALREDVDPSFAARVMLSLILRDAVRERTVRALQGRHDTEAPQRDLRTLARTFLRH